MFLGVIKPVELHSCRVPRLWLRRTWLVWECPVCRQCWRIEWRVYRDVIGGVSGARQWCRFMEDRRPSTDPSDKPAPADAI